jgi:hypothetical protein
MPLSRMKEQKAKRNKEIKEQYKGGLVNLLL